METTNADTPQPEAMLHTSGIDTELIQALSRHWVVVVEAEQPNRVITITLYTKKE
jgi:hypothetical protein